MSEKPILFNTSMVQAILEDRKTVTRRLVKGVSSLNFIGFVSCSTPKSNEGKAAFGKGSFVDIVNANIEEYVKPPYRPGDILYVRETWKKYKKRVDSGIAEFYGYKADENNHGNPSEFYEGKWKPSIHMPKEAARIFLRVTNVRVERLQSITEEDIQKEGIEETFPPIAEDDFRRLWDSTIKKEDIETYSFKANPWVWVIEFERIEKGSNSNGR
jgi:hypothetical protein